MAAIKPISEKDNYTAVNLGKLADIGDHKLLDENGKVMAQGKVFLKDSIKATGSQISYTMINPGESSPFFHLHRENEEIYMIIKGEGEYQVEDSVFPISEGSVIRVATGASRGMKNTGKEPMIVICFQSKEGSFPTEPEYEITQTEPKFT